MEKAKKAVVEFAANATVWASTHVKQIVIGAGLACFGVVCYRAGYNRAVSDYTEMLCDGIVDIVKEKAEWTR